MQLYLTNMDNKTAARLLKSAQEVLKQNDRKKWTVPAGELYPHQWLWDSCFIAIGLRHLSLERAQTEIRSLVRGQWSNGMLPNLIFDNGAQHRRERELWRSYVSPYSPDDVATTGLTQPPMLAEAVVKIGEKLRLPERRSWYGEIFPALLAHHRWLYAERNPHGEGLVILIHPYESGMDNSPPWVSEMRRHSTPTWVRLVKKLRLEGAASLVRRDTRHIPPGQRISTFEAMVQWAALRRLRHKAYNSESILGHPLFAVEDLLFNSVLVKANEHLRKIAETIGRKLPDKLLANMQSTSTALEKLWDERSGQYYSRSFISHTLIEEPSIATFMPLYAGTITKERAIKLVELMRRRKKFGANWPIPSVPADSPFFDPYKYWQGPTWINTNWLIIEGLKNFKFEEESEILRRRTLELVAASGMNEYFNPNNGEPAGAPNFSWTAALTIDLLQH